MTEPPADATDLVYEYIEMWNNRDYGRIPDLVSESFVMVSPKIPEGGARGAAGLESYIRTLVEGFPDIHVRVDELVAEGNVVMLEATITGTHTGELQGLPPTGRSVEFTTFEKYTVSDGALERHVVQMNEKDLQAELGLTFPEVLGLLPKLLVNKLRSMR